MLNQTIVNTQNEVIIPDPPIARLLFSSTRLSWLWLIMRVYLGWQWLSSGWGKFNNPAWIDTGEALKGFWTKAIIIPAEGRPAIAYDWYRSFLQLMLDQGWHTWFAKVILFSELAIGLALILGAFVGIAAFGGALLNWNFMMAGTASSNPMLFVIAIGLILAWKVSGYVGLDRYLLPWIGTPWRGQTVEEVPQTKPAPA